MNGKREGVLEDNFKEWFFNRVIPRAGAAVFHAELLKNHLFDETLVDMKMQNLFLKFYVKTEWLILPIDVDDLFS